MDGNTKAREEVATTFEVSQDIPQSHNAEGTQFHSDDSAKSTTAFASDTGKFSAAGLANWAKNLRINPNSNAQTNSTSGEATKNPFSLLSNSFNRRSAPKIPVVDAPLESPSVMPTAQEGAFGNIAKGFFDTSKNAMKAVQLKARHLVSQNKRRYQEDGFDLDLAYITDNIIAMGFPAGDLSSGFLGYVEGFYRNHMEEVINFFETHHKDKYKVYNLCSERLYDASLFEGKVACFPFNDHNCPPLQLVAAFCQSAYSWLKADLDNVVVVHCKAGKARTGLMISSLLLYLKFYPTAEESIVFYNQKRCVDGKGLILPSQLRYVKYFERVLRNCNGETPMGRKVVLRGFRLHKCPYWIRPSITISDHNGIIFSSKKHPRTKDMMPEDIWFNAPRKGIMVFALPGERGLADLSGDFKVLFHDRHGDFYCWLNTNMMENRTMLGADDLDGFDKRRLPSPGFQVEIVILEYDVSMNAQADRESADSTLPSAKVAVPPASSTTHGNPSQTTVGTKNGAEEKDDVFSDTESEGSVRKRAEGIEQIPTRPTAEGVGLQPTGNDQPNLATDAAVSGKVIQNSANDAYPSNAIGKNTQDKEEGSVQNSRNVAHEPAPAHSVSETTNAHLPPSDFKAIAAASAADASVFTFGDEEDFESEDD
ncbi:hypothetical protein GOP47_0015560 [Adiantum capillus-veneris]|uniref:Uncharacterized protein n=2 Tax=Euphyllophyta TaxID=78536 RepID=A0A9D4UJX6_ADICA|nr:hypothetical protein GOP47_0015560 [Adiantum capillus-veneris]